MFWPRSNWYRWEIDRSEQRKAKIAKHRKKQKQIKAQKKAQRKKG